MTIVACRGLFKKERLVSKNMFLFHCVGVVLSVIEAIGLFYLSSWLLNKAVEAK
ncbi:hypothetical protein FIU87_07855 [Bacillus sp. THAF10]|nr:hypothetical protein FIU87_07855 [Bacillus sp. THAF10]